MPEKFILVIASGFAFTYAVINNDISLISNYGPILALDIIAFAMRFYYMGKNRAIISSVDLESQSFQPKAVQTDDFELDVAK
jgi:hypothetical protein